MSLRPPGLPSAPPSHSFLSPFQVIRTSLDGLEWSHGNTWDVVDNTGGNPGDTAIENVWSLTFEVFKLLHTTPDHTRLSDAEVRSHGFLFNDDEAINYPTPPYLLDQVMRSNGRKILTKADAYDAYELAHDLFWSRDRVYLDNVFNMTAVQQGGFAPQLREFLNTTGDGFYATTARKYEDLPSTLKGFRQLSIQRNFAVNDLNRTWKYYRAMAPLPAPLRSYGPYCRAAWEFTTSNVGKWAGLVGQAKGTQFWPGVPLYGPRRKGTGYIFGSNLLVSPLEIVQERRQNVTCNTEHAEYVTGRSIMIAGGRWCGAASFCGVHTRRCVCGGGGMW